MTDARVRDLDIADPAWETTQDTSYLLNDPETQIDSRDVPLEDVLARRCAWIWSGSQSLSATTNTTIVYPGQVPTLPAGDQGFVTNTFGTFTFSNESRLHLMTLSLTLNADAAGADFLFVKLQRQNPGLGWGWITYDQSIAEIRMLSPDSADVPDWTTSITVPVLYEGSTGFEYRWRVFAETRGITINTGSLIVERA